ncbi:glycosyl hydrolase family 95 catalytic domain-containing protein [Hamadaea tsunoensis]|uniref:glycosyl hydrolase family 95 catalytic domain-containing protein n=1 Tax=Hamadaea tsunoensis TaxID=53368 RepID=UPI0004034226|nr:carbohydrate-binding domain-containing protein [Hamadaea tsunoensis]
MEIFERGGVRRRSVLGAALGGSAAIALPPGAGNAVNTGGPAHRGPDLAPAAAALNAAQWTIDDRMTTDTQWSDFLRAQDLIWKHLPTQWHEGPFLGDGRLGTLVYQEPGKNQVRFTVQHAEVQDHRPEFGSLFGLARLPVGHLTLEPVGTISAVDWRLSLWDAEVTGTITTSSGTLTFTALIHDQVLVISATATGGEQVRWTFHAEAAVSPRAASETPPAGYTANPAPTTKTVGAVTQVVQTLLSGGETVTAYQKVGSLFVLSVAHSYPAMTAEATSLSRVQTAAGQTLATHQATQRAWWHAFYRKSFVSIPDQRMQAFHWIQLYKAACGTRAGGPVMATTGPWLEATPWPGVWWNLNVQLEYWLINGSNHLELDAVTSTLFDNRQQLIDNVPSAYRSDSSGVGRSSDMFANRAVPTPGGSGTTEVGDLTWALHNAWLSYRHAMDDTLLRDKIFPILRRAVNYYLHFLTTDSAGKMHLPQTFSPEYGVDAPDCNYDLALLRWGCQTLIDAANRLAIADPLLGTWQNVLNKLTAYPTDANGFMIGAGVPFAMSHRHYSHMLMVYPLYLVNWEQPANRGLIQTSVDHWIGLTGAHRGYSYTGAASFYGQMGRGDTALSYLNTFFDTSVSYPIRANTMYTESGPVVETPLSFSQALFDLLCTSWGDTVRVFPAVPSAWADVTLKDFRTQGAFLVSAVRSAGTTRWVAVRSLAGEPLRLRHGISTAVRHEAENATITQGVVEFNHPGFSGTGFVNGDNAVGASVQWSVTAVAAGPHTLRIRYANGTTVDRPMSISVNGTVLVAAQSFPSTGTWEGWATLTLTATLAAGSNTVRLAATTVNGGPNLDYLEIEAQPAVVQYQAEAAAVTLGVVESNHTGYTGTGFVNGDNVSGAAVQWSIPAAAAGPVTLAIRYANGTAVDRPMSITVNGAVVRASQSFPATGSWDTWAVAAVPAAFLAGANTVRLESTTANGGPNLDRLDVTSVSAALSVTLDDGTTAAWSDLGDGVIQIDLPRGRQVLVRPAADTGTPAIAPVAISRPGTAWGLP